MYVRVRASVRAFVRTCVRAYALWTAEGSDGRADSAVVVMRRRKGAQTLSGKKGIHQQKM